MMNKSNLGRKRREENRGNEGRVDMKESEGEQEQCKKWNK